jgi:hypothetical protein
MSRLTVAVLTVVLWALVSTVFAFTLTSTQDADGTATLNGTSGETIAPTGGVYYWSASPSDDLNLDAYYLRSTNRTTMTLDLLRNSVKGRIYGTNATSLSTYTTVGAAVVNGGVVITNAGDISAGGIDTRIAGWNDQACGHLVIGSASNRVGNVRLNYLYTGGAWTYQRPGTIAIYGSGSVKIQNQDTDAGSTRGNIVATCFGAGQGHARKSILIRHNGAFRAGDIDAHVDADNAPATLDITLDGGGGGALDVTGFKTYSTYGSGWGAYGGDVTVSNYDGVTISNLDTHVMTTALTAGNVSIASGITDDILITGTIDLSAAGSTNSSGALELATIAGSRLGIRIGSTTNHVFDLAKCRYARFHSASHKSYITGIVTNFSGANDPRLRAAAGQFISYNPAVNPGLGGRTYQLCDPAGNPDSGGQLCPPIAMGTVVTFR